MGDGPDTTIGTGAVGLLHLPATPTTEQFLIPLINEISALTDRVLLVLDDYHFVENDAIHEALSFLIEHAPGNLHLAIATRQDPPLALARLRAREEMTELRAADLRFSTFEAADFMNRMTDLALSAEQLATLEARTEGWVAGLQLAALSWKGRGDAVEAVESFAGSNRHVNDYLFEEVLSRQPGELRRFLLETSILDRMTGALCDALTGREDGQDTLEFLDQANTFIVPLDNERRWYRYHHLFTDLLRMRLERRFAPASGEQVIGAVELHVRASRWWETNGFAETAIGHTLQACDYDRAARLIGKQADAQWQQGAHEKLRHWLESLPIEVIQTQPLIGVFQAWYLCHAGQRDASENFLQAVERALESADHRAAVSDPASKTHDAVTERMKILGRAATTRACLASYRSDVPGIIHHAHRALEYLPEHDRSWRGMTALILGDAHFLMGDMASAYKAQIVALQACRAAGHVFNIMAAQLKLAITLRHQGRLNETIEICGEQLRVAEANGLAHTSAVGWMLTIWGETLSELNDLPQAVQKAREGVGLIERNGGMAEYGWGYVYLLRILFSLGDLDAAEGVIRKMELVARESDVPPGVDRLIAGWQTRIWLAQKKLEAASQWKTGNNLIPGNDLTLP